MSFKQLTVSSTPVSLPTGPDKRFFSAYVSVESDGIGIRYRLDGSSPSGSAGHIAYSASAFLLDRDNYINFKAISADSHDAVVSITISEYK